MPDEIDALLGSLLDSEPVRRRRTGRPSVFDELGLTVDDFRKAYAECGTVRKAAKKLHVSDRTVRKYLYGEVKPPGRPTTEQLWRVPERSAIHTWFCEHRDEVLPASGKAIATMSGFTQGVVHHYLRKRRKAVERYAASCPKLNTFRLYFKDELNRKVPSTMIRSQQYSVNKYSLNVTAVLSLSTGATRTVVFSFQDFIQLMQQVNPF